MFLIIMISTRLILRLRFLFLVKTLYNLFVYVLRSGDHLRRCWLLIKDLLLPCLVFGLIPQRFIGDKFINNVEFFLKGLLRFDPWSIFQIIHRGPPPLTDRIFPNNIIPDLGCVKLSLKFSRPELAKLR